MSRVRFATSNMYKHLNVDQSALHVLRVTIRADIVVWEEVTDVHRATLKALPGWQTHFGIAGMAISWRTARFRVRRAGRSRRVVPGIERVDPGRGFVDIVLRDRHDLTDWPILCTHMTHQVFTSHPERWARWALQAWRLRRRSRRLAKRWGRMLGGGDVNRHRWAPKGTIGEWPSGGTLGWRKYDVLWRRGRVELVRGAREIHTPSDHDSSVATYQST